MNTDTINQLIETLRAKSLLAYEQGNESLFDEMRAVIKIIKDWQANGMVDSLPHQEQLRSWGIELDGLVDHPATNLPVTEPEVAETNLEPTLEPSFASDDVSEQAEATESSVPPELQREYEGVLALVQQGRYHRAIEMLRELQNKAVDLSFAEQVKQLLTQTSLELNEKIKEAVTQAQQFATHQPQELKKQEELWQKVLDIDPEHEEAQQKLRQLVTETGSQRVVQQIERIRANVFGAVSGQQLPMMQEMLAQAQTLAEQNNNAELQPPLDELLAFVRGERDKLRDKLGAASTLAVSGNLQEAYSQAKDYLARGVKTMVDTAGLFGAADSEVQTTLFFTEIRKRFISSLKNLAEQRLEIAENLEKKSPPAALRTLQEARQFLSHEVLTAEDLKELAPTRETLDGRILTLQEPLLAFEEAEKLVLKAQEAGLSLTEQYQYYQQAKAKYGNYPDIEVYIAQTQASLARQMVGKVQEELSLASLELAREQFEVARQRMGHIRQEVYDKFAKPAPDSELDLALQEINRFIEQIGLKQTQYEQLLGSLNHVDQLLEHYEQNPQPTVLKNVRLLLEQLNSDHPKHPKIRERERKLFLVQGEKENWQQGVQKYQQHDWAGAIESLETVVGSLGAADQKQAQLMIARAKAAQFFEKGQEAEKNKQWGEAIRNYREAYEQFDKLSGERPDEAQRFYEEAQKGIDRLRPLAENDKRVQELLEKARQYIKIGRENENYSSLGKVDPIPEFASAIELLNQAKQIESTLTSQILSALNEAREQWRRLYLRGMQDSLQNENAPSILEKAIKLGAELDEHNLLLDRTDKQVYQKLQEKILDIQHKHLLLNPAVNIRAIEDNRQKRLQLEETNEEVRKQYWEAVENRVLMELGFKKAQKPEIARVYLKGEMDKGELYQSSRLWAEFMFLCWEDKLWDYAQEQGRNLRYRPHLPQALEQSELWCGLTKAAKLLATDDNNGYRGEIDTLKNNLPTSFVPFIENYDKRLVDERIQQLEALANEAKNSPNEEHWIESARLFALVKQLKEGAGLGSEVTQKALEEVGGRLKNNLDIYLAEIRRLEAREPLTSVIEQANSKLQSLKAIYQVKKVLNLGEPLGGELDEAIKELERKLKIWGEVEDVMKKYKHQLRERLHNPLTKGWDLSGLDKPLTELLVKIGNASSEAKLKAFINQEKTQWQTYDALATQLNEFVELLKDAFKQEDFDQIIKTANELEALWDKQRDTFGGLEEIIKLKHPFANRELRSLKDYREEAQRQRDNLAEWLRWKEEVNKLNQEMEHSYSPLKGGLDSLKDHLSLEEISTKCDKVIQKVTQLKEKLNSPPEQNPLSQKAKEVEFNMDVTQLQTKCQTNAKTASEMLGEIKIQADQLPELLKNLRRANFTLQAQIADYENHKAGGIFTRPKPFPSMQLKTVQKRLQECLAIDLFNSEVVKLQQELVAIKKKYNIGNNEGGN